MSFCKEHIHKSLAAVLPEGKLLLCVSGGADSMALLHACSRCGYDFLVVHCDFHLRGEESERDREFVVAACERLGVECVQVHFDVKEYMREHGVSEEMACRELRYAEFRRLKEERGCVRIVTAHNRDDNDETMLLNLFRGTGVSGLCGMRADTGEIARPLLEVSRREIEEYLALAGERYIIDSSNLSVEYKRNFIRRELLPLIRQKWPGLDKALLRTRRNMAACERALESITNNLQKEADFLSAENYEAAADRSLLLHSWLKSHGSSPTQIDEMSAELRPGKHWVLKDCIVAMQRDGLHILPLTSAICEYEHTKRPMTAELMSEIRGNVGDERLYYTGNEILTFRAPRPGERMSPFGMKGTKLVSDLLHEAGIPVPRRAYVVVAADSRDRIIWIPGVRRSRYLAVRPDSSVVNILTRKK